MAFLTSRDRFSGAPSGLGYLYQFRFALLQALQKGADAQGQRIRLEVIDDVELLNSEGSPVEVIQTKHRLIRRADLTDGDPSLWKTLRIWIERRASGAINDATQLTIVTTGVAPDGSAAAFLRPSSGGRNETSAHGLLIEAARESKNRETASARASFVALGAEGRARLLERVVVLDRQQRVDSLDREIERELRRACDPAHRNYFRELLEGWWMGECVAQMLDETSLGIPTELVDNFIDELRGKFTQDSLPVEEFSRANEQLLESHSHSKFVAQLKAVGITDEPSLTRAIWDYVRAYRQRSRWEREGLVTVSELPDYESRLVDDWEGRYIAMCRNIDEASSDEVMQEAGRSLYEWVETDADTRVRERVTHRWLTRGCYQMLSDQVRVGWHPRYLDRLGLEEGVPDA